MDHTIHKDEDDKHHSPNNSCGTTEFLSLNTILRAVWRRKMLVVLVSAVFVVLSTAAAFLLTPIYRADVLMTYMGQGERGGGLSSLVSQYANVASLGGLNIEAPGSHKDEAIATLLSRSFTMQFIDNMKIMPDLFPKVDFESSSDRDDLPTRGDAFRKFDEEIRKVTENNKTGLITLSIDFSDRFLAADWANSIVALANSIIRQRAIDDSTRSIEYLTRELEKTAPEELRQSIYDLIQGHIGNIMLANVHEQYAFKVIDSAVVPDEDAFESPKRLLMIISGGIVGLLIGMFIACWKSFFKT